MSIENVHHHLIETGLVPEAERVHWLACSFAYREKLERALSDALGDDWDYTETEASELKEELAETEDALEAARDKSRELEDKLAVAHRAIEDGRALLRQALDGPPSKDARDLAKKALSKLETVEL